MEKRYILNAEIMCNALQMVLNVQMFCYADYIMYVYSKLQVHRAWKSVFEYIFSNNKKK